MKNLSMVGLLIGSTFLLSACSTSSLERMSKHLQERNCQTEGTLIASSLGPATAQLSWVCPKPDAQ